MSILRFIYHQLFKRNYYAITSPIRVLPDFLIIGAKRCGTTSLFHHLPEHPSIAKSHHDNIGFFNDNFHLGVNWYRSFFSTISYKKKMQKKYGKFLSFDVTTRYMESRRTAENVKKIKPEIKIIIMLRNPIDRAYSQFNVSVRDRTENREFQDAISQEINMLEQEFRDKDDTKLHEFSNDDRHYIKKSLYAMQLKPWFELFPRNNILVLSTEEFKKDDSLTYKQIFNFLNIPKFSIKGKKLMEKGNYSPMKKDTREILSDYFKDHNEELFKLIEKKYEWEN